MGSNSAEYNAFLRAIKICSMTSFGGEVKPLAPCHKILWHVKNHMNVKEIVGRQNSSAIFHQVSLALLLDISAGNCQRALVDKSGMIRNQTGKHNR
jgi:hypothetical protein